VKNYNLKIYPDLLVVLLEVFLMLTNVGYSQQETDVVAQVGSIKITVEEFKDRYEFMPHLNYSSDNTDTVKKEFLYSLIAEKLWSLEGSQRRFDTLESVKYSLESLRRLLIRDELYKTEIEPKIKISDEEIRDGLQKVTLELLVKIISTEDSSEIFRISDQLIKGADFDSILSTRKENNLQQAPVRIVFGSLDDESVENLLFNMNTGSISLPVKSGNGWFIFKLVSKNQNSGVNLSTQQPKNMVMRTLQDRKMKQVGGAYLDSLIGGKSVEADGKIFLKIFNALYSVLSNNYPNNLHDSSFIVTLSEKQVLKTINSISSSDLITPFIKIDGSFATANDFLYYLNYQQIELENLNRDQVKRKLNASVRQFIEDEMLVREGIKRGLANNRDVIKSVSMWRDYYNSQLLMESMYDSIKISEEELDKYLNSRNNSNNSNSVQIDSLLYKAAYKEQLALERLQEILTRKTIEFAEKYAFKINNQLIEKINLSELNTFTYKLIGFGGRIAAFPITIPIYDWYYKLQNKKSSLP
jgi:hypothetical protein